MSSTFPGVHLTTSVHSFTLKNHLQVFPISPFHPPFLLTNIFTHFSIRGIISSFPPKSFYLFSFILLYFQSNFSLRLNYYYRQSSITIFKENQQSTKIQSGPHRIFISIIFLVLEFPTFLSKLLLYTVFQESDYEIQLITYFGHVCTVLDSYLNFASYVIGNRDLCMAIRASICCPFGLFGVTGHSNAEPVRIVWMNSHQFGPQTPSLPFQCVPPF